MQTATIVHISKETGYAAAQCTGERPGQIALLPLNAAGIVRFDYHLQGHYVDRIRSRGWRRQIQQRLAVGDVVYIEVGQRVERDKLLAHTWALVGDYVDFLQEQAKQKERRNGQVSADVIANELMMPSHLTVGTMLPAGEKAQDPACFEADPEDEHPTDTWGRFDRVIAPILS